VKTGIRGSRMIEVVDGVSEQDVVASPTETSFRDGMRVRAQLEEAARVRAPGAP
jgi:hypothetical protein